MRGISRFLMPTCQETFRPYVDDSGAFDYEAFESAHPGLCCEIEICSEHSLGCIDSVEEVAFLLIDPGHVDAVTGVVAPDAFDELFRRDLSVVRTVYSTVEELEYTKGLLVKRGMDRNPPQIRHVDLVSTVSARNLRDITLDNERVLGLYDTALPLQKAHGSVIAKQIAKSVKLNRKKLRAIVHEVMTMSVVEYSAYRERIANLRSIRE